MNKRSWYDILLLTQIAKQKNKNNEQDVLNIRNPQMLSDVLDIYTYIYLKQIITKYFLFQGSDHSFSLGNKRAPEKGANRTHLSDHFQKESRGSSHNWKKKKPWTLLMVHEAKNYWMPRIQATIFFSPRVNIEVEGKKKQRKNKGKWECI